MSMPHQQLTIKHVPSFTQRRCAGNQCTLIWELSCCALEPEHMCPFPARHLDAQDMNACAAECSMHWCFMHVMAADWDNQWGYRPILWLMCIGNTAYGPISSDAHNNNACSADICYTHGAADWDLIFAANHQLMIVCCALQLTNHCFIWWYIQIMWLMCIGTT